jgi:predicted ATPase
MLLERGTELGRLHGVLSGLGSGGGRVVLVRGEAGVGKTALVRSFVSEVEDQAHVLVGECDDLLTPSPLGPVWDLARSEGSIATPLGEGDRRSVMEALLDLLSRKLRPTVLLLEDVQWADDATLDVIRFLGRRIARTTGMLVLTYRDGEVDTEHPLR